jgi:hypothetical protein
VPVVAFLHANAEMNKTSSEVWKYFTEKYENGVRKTVCKLCQKKLLYFSGTTNIRNHLQMRHKLVNLTSSKATTSFAAIARMSNVSESSVCTISCAPGIFYGEVIFTVFGQNRGI